MKKIILGFGLVFLLHCSASAQTAQNTWGLGVGLVSGGAVFHIPIIFDKIRVEPEISFRTSSSNSSYTSYQYPENYSDAYSTSSSSQSVSLGTGVYYAYRIDNVADWYIGPRLGIIFNSSLTDRTDLFTDTTYQRTTIDHSKQHTTTYFAGLAFGGEYYLSSHFSVGAELLVTYNTTGQPVTDNTHIVTPPLTPEIYTYYTTPTQSSSSSFAGSTAVYIRWYF